MRLAGNLHFEMIFGLALRGAGALSSFALIWIIARIYGAELVGTYQLGIATVALAATVALLGRDILLVRDAGRLLPEGDGADVRSEFFLSRRIVWSLGIVLAIALALFVYSWGEQTFGEPLVTLFLLILAPTIPLLASLRLSNALLRVNGNVIASQSLEGVTYTSLALLAIAGVWALSSDAPSRLLPPIAFTAAVFVAAALSMLLARKLARLWPIGGKARADIGSGFAMATGPLVALSGEWIVLLAISATLGLVDTGIYRTAFQIGLLFHMVNTSFAMMAGPHLARAAAAADRNAVIKTVRSAGLIGLVLCLPVALVALLAPAWLLGLVGPEFRAGAVALQILVIAQLVNVGIGPVGTGVTMLGRADAVLKIELIASSAAVIIALVTMPVFGIVGAALGALAASLLRNVLNFAMLRTQLRDLDGSTGEKREA